MRTDSVFRDVLGSSVRSDVLLATVAVPKGMDELIETVEASESAVYNAVGELQRRGLVRSVPDGYEVTGSGQLIADLLDQQENLCTLLGDDYWRNHDVGALPRQFRIRLTELAEAEIFRATDTDPHAVVRRVCERVEAGSPNVDVVTPIYQAEYEAVMPDSPDARLLLNASLVEEVLDRVDSLEEAQQFDETPVRILDVDVGIGVADDHLMLSLPTSDGQYDSRTEVFATDRRALAWGRDLFEYYWERGQPDHEFLAERGW